MATVTLTDQTVRAAKARRGERLELWDALTPGLCLRVSGGGGKTWVLRYRTPGGKQPRHQLGDAHHMGLKAARLEAGRLRELIARGGDPAAEQREARERARREALDTFDRLTASYWTACEIGEWKPKRKVKRASTLAFEKRLYERHVRPVLGDTPVAQVRRPTVKALLRDMAAKGIGSQTNRVQAIIRQIFNYAIEEELAEVNPAAGFQSLHAPRPRRRIWKDAELRALWKALNSAEPLRTPEGRPIYLGRPVAIALQLTIILLQRRAEIAGMDLDELDLDQGLWVIPPERAKSGRPHLVPLPPFAVSLIREALRISGLPADRMKGPVFPSPRECTRPLNPEALTRAMDRLRDCLELEDLTVHDLRRTGSTALTSERLRVSPFIRSKVLGHESDAGGGATVSSVHYDVNEYVSDKRAALQAWESLLLQIVHNGAAAVDRGVRTSIVRSFLFGLVPANDPDSGRMATTPSAGV